MKPYEAVEPLITAAEIDRRVREVGAEISERYAGRPLLLLGVLRGSTLFLADLARAISIPVEIDFVRLASYGAGTASSGRVKIVDRVRSDVRDRDVLIVEDIVDTGFTVRRLVAYLRTFRPRSVAVCTLLSKPARRQVDLALDYVGFEIPDRFVIGYGLDHANMYRNLPFIGCLDDEPV